MSREVFYRRTPAVFATLVYLTSLPVLRNGRLAMLDGALLCFAVLMMLCLLRSRRDLRYMLGVGVGLGLICLTKGIMIGLLLGTIALLFLVGDTPRLLKSPYTWIGLLFGCVPVALWYGAQWVHYGQVFLTNNLGKQSFQRIWADVENNHGAPWYYLLEILKYGAPWVLFLPLGYRLAWQNRNLSWAKLALVWGVVYFLAISLMATKLPWYVLPIYPALALAIGAQLAEFWEQGRHIGVLQSQLSPYPRIWVWLFGLIALVAWSGVLFFGLQYSPAETDLQAVMAAVGITMMVVVVLLIQQNAQFLTVLGWGTYLSLLLLMGSDHWVWELAEAYPVEPVAALIQGSAPASQEIYTSYPYNRPSLNFYSNRPVLPAEPKKLERVWRQATNPYLLLDQKSLETLKLKRQKIVGRAEGWVLVTKNK
jgi:4-amino-4-deoxy-L-arabinose transferase-like glycosyltransferase